MHVMNSKEVHKVISRKNIVFIQCKIYIWHFPLPNTLTFLYELEHQDKTKCLTATWCADIRVVRKHPDSCKDLG